MAVQARSLEVLQALGLGKVLAERGRTTTRLKLHVDRGKPPEIDLGTVARADTRFPYILFVSQANTEAVMVSTSSHAVWSSSAALSSRRFRLRVTASDASCATLTVERSGVGFVTSAAAMVRIARLERHQHSLRGRRVPSDLLTWGRRSRRAVGAGGHSCVRHGTWVRDVLSSRLSHYVASHGDGGRGWSAASFE